MRGSGIEAVHERRVQLLMLFLRAMSVSVRMPEYARWRASYGVLQVFREHLHPTGWVNMVLVWLPQGRL